MNIRQARLATHDLLAGDDEEISSIRPITVFQLAEGIEVDPAALDRRLDLAIAVEIEALTADRGAGEPAPVYARPYCLVDGVRCDFARDHYLGTRFPTGIIESEAWEQEIRAAGASERVVAECRRYLTDGAL